MTTATPPVDHEASIEREILDCPPIDGWAVRKAGPNARTTCSCGLDTGWIPTAQAIQARRDHPPTQA